MKIYSYNGSANIVGKIVKQLRTERNMSQDTLATKLQLRNINISQNAVSRIEIGERFVTDYELLAFSEIFGVDLYKLYGIKKSNGSH